MKRHRFLSLPAAAGLLLFLLILDAGPCRSERAAGWEMFDSGEDEGLSVSTLDDSKVLAEQVPATPVSSRAGGWEMFESMEEHGRETTEAVFAPGRLGSGEMFDEADSTLSGRMSSELLRPIESPQESSSLPPSGVVTGERRVRSLGFSPEWKEEANRAPTGAREVLRNVPEDREGEGAPEGGSQTGRLPQESLVRVGYGLGDGPVETSYGRQDAAFPYVAPAPTPPPFSQGFPSDSFSADASSLQVLGATTVGVIGPEMMEITEATVSPAPEKPGNETGEGKAPPGDIPQARCLADLRRFREQGVPRIRIGKWEYVLEEDGEYRDPIMKAMQTVQKRRIFAERVKVPVPTPRPPIPPAPPGSVTRWVEPPSGRRTTRR